jgi:hypothetical protein
MKLRVAAAVAGICVLALIPAVSQAHVRHCRGFNAGGFHFRVTVRRGPEVRCGTARSVLHKLMSGKARLHNRGAPAYKQWYSVPYAWRCGLGAGGGVCIRGSESYRTAHDVIEADST